MHVLILLFLALPECTNSAPIAQRESQISEESTSGEFEIGSNDAELSLLESQVKDKRNLNMGRQVKMDDYELLKKRRTILGEGNVDLIVDFIDLEMEASKNWNKGDFISEDLTLGESDFVIYLEMKKKIIFMENQMRKNEVQHVTLKPFDKNLKTLKDQFQNLSDKIGSNERVFIEEFFQHADRFLKEAQARFVGDDHDVHNDSIKDDDDVHNDSIKTLGDDQDVHNDSIKDDDVHNDSIKAAENIKKPTQESSEESIEDNGSHFHPKFKSFWNEEGDDFHEHHRTTAESDSVMKSAISKSRFGWSMDVLAVVGFVIVLVTLALVKLALSRRRGSFHKVAKC